MGYVRSPSVGPSTVAFTVHCVGGTLLSRPRAGGYLAVSNPHNTRRTIPPLTISLHPPCRASPSFHSFDAAALGSTGSTQHLSTWFTPFAPRQSQRIWAPLADGNIGNIGLSCGSLTPCGGGSDLEIPRLSRNRRPAGPKRDLQDSRKNKKN
ncbi:hypothetical protein L209DRAFT_103558 [Thermothelomyces heterothallicus CBS 203.75]